ncbi:hypothetical protein DMN91_003665 [Ooceraea biroi]|uniref:WH1 domain-containing protein n=1 Tax=Ooceraea biroi TaxID=2015173 RepID=A0A3L8DSV4_OOCBI|nr:hypothetical protein DMN91_003665 [Ooceraea biroi]
MRWSYETYSSRDHAQGQDAFSRTRPLTTQETPLPHECANVQHSGYRQLRSSWQQDSRSCEVSISSARASVMVYDDVNKKWIPSGSSSGLSKVQLYHHQVNNTFRVVGRKLQDHEIVINCAILKGLKYNQATVTFHQWRDNKQVYGLNFSSKDDADAFARAMLQALDQAMQGVSGVVPAPPQMSSGPGVGPPVPPPQPPIAPPAPPCPPAMMNFSSSAAPAPPMMMNQYAQSPSQSNLASQQSQCQSIYQGNQYGAAPTSNQYATATAAGGGAGSGATTVVGQSPSQYPPSGNQNFYGTNNQTGNYAASGQVGAGQYSQPAGNQAAPYGSGNQYGSSSSINQYTTGAPSGPASQYAVAQPGQSQYVSQAQAQYGGAGQVQAAVTGTTNPYGTPSNSVNQYAASGHHTQQSQPVENSGSSTSSSGSAGGGGNYGTLGRGGGGGMASMMDEMAKTLARRRAAAEKKQPEQPPEPESSPDKKSWDKNSSSNKFSNGAESPKSVRKRFGSASEDTLLKVNGVNDGTSLTAQEMEAFKAEIIKEVRKEFQKMKQEIIDDNGRSSQGKLLALKLMSESDQSDLQSTLGHKIADFRKWVDAQADDDEDDHQCGVAWPGETRVYAWRINSQV